MQLILSMKWLPEMRQRSWKERRQALWQAGLKPYRSWRLWLSMALTSLVVLWALDLVLGFLLSDPSYSNSDKGFFAMLTLLLLISIPAFFVCWHSYLSAMRPYLARIRFDPAGSWFGAFCKGLLMDVLFALLFGGFVVGLDWAINCYDEAPDARIESVLKWPEPIADVNNGYIAAAGLQAKPGTAPFDAGQRWVSGVNDTIARKSNDYPEQPDDLKYVAYVLPPMVTKPEPERAGTYAKFCDPGQTVCTNIVRREQKSVETWLAANQELLTRYLALQKYLDWQDTIKPGSLSTPFARRTALLNGQSLMHAAALLAAEKKQTGKAIDMLGDDIRFVRNMLGSKDNLIGKMTASTLLARDLAVLSEIIDAHPNELKPYWAQLEKMVEPLTASQVSVANAFRFEQRWVLSAIGQMPVSEASGTELPGQIGAWADHHFKRNASANMMMQFWDQMNKTIEVNDASYTPPVEKSSAKALTKFSPLFGFMHNQMGKMLTQISTPEYSMYPNRLYDLNALNNLVHARLVIARDNIAAQDVPAFLLKAGKSMQNPETGKPFEWDGENSQIYYAPAVEWFGKRFALRSAQPGRVALNVTAPAAKGK